MVAKTSKEPVNQFSDSIDDWDKAINEAVANWETEQVGFPPYWKADVGKRILCKVIMADLRDPNFGRFVLEACRVPVRCQRGPADDAQEVIVQPGEYFTMSTYGGLPVEAMQNLFDCEILLSCVGERKLPPTAASGNKPRDFFDFDIKVSPESKKVIAGRKSEYNKQLSAARTKPALPISAEKHF